VKERVAAVKSWRLRPPPTAGAESVAGIDQVAGIKQQGVRAGNWLTQAQQKTLINCPGPFQPEG
jgi:hypothetical protein